MERFLEGNIWAAFCKVAEARGRVIANELSNPDMTPSLDKVRLLQGEWFGIMFWLQFPETLKAEALRQERENGKE
jgi:hypothetical protein